MTSNFSAEQISAVDARLKAASADLARAESLVRALAAEGAYDHVALYAQVAAHRATHRHSGRFASPVLEDALIAAARHLESEVPEPVGESAPATRQRVLHVATEVAFPEGGHGRAVERWVAVDGARQHSLVLTSPRAEPPAYLHRAIESAGGMIHFLARDSSSFKRRALELRRLARGFDLLVLHSHPWDVVVTMALAWPGRPPTVTSNHAGHLFWLGRAISDLVSCGRPAAKEICVERRGIPAAACVQVPVAAAALAATAPQRAEARAALAAGDRELVMLTIASEFKLRAADERDFLGTVESAIQQRPGLLWRVAGPGAQGLWAALEQRTAGRVRALGPRADLATLYAGADLYLDSYPFSSQTALLDAAAARLPLLAAEWHPPAARILGAWGGAADDAISGFADAASLTRLLDDLASPERRKALGDEAARAVAETIAGASSSEKLERIYRGATERVQHRTAGGLVANLSPPDDRIDDLDRYLACLYSLPDPNRVLINWHRELTNHGAADVFPGDEVLASSSGLAGLIGELDLIVRDFEAYTRQLERAATPPD